MSLLLVIFFNLNFAVSLFNAFNYSFLNMLIFFIFLSTFIFSHVDHHVLEDIICMHAYNYDFVINFTVEVLRICCGENSS